MDVSIQESGDAYEFRQHILQVLNEYGDEEFSRSLIEVFIRDGAKALGHLRSSVASRDAVKAFAAAHSLKNMLGIMRSTRGMELAELACTQLHEGIPEPGNTESGTPDSGASTFHELSGLTERLIEECRAIIKAP